MVKHQFLEENMELVKRLIRSGDMSGLILSQYKIYQVYKKQETKKDRKMDRYEVTAEVCGCGTKTVRRAIISMGTKI